MWPWQRSVAPDEPVRLGVQGLGWIDARVVRAVPGAAELLLRAADGSVPPIPARFLHGRACRLAPIPGDTGDVLNGRVIAVRTPTGGLHAELVHVVFTLPARGVAGGADGPGSAGSTPAPTRQRRAFHRARVTAPVTLVPDRFRVGWLDGCTRDLSAGGALVTGADRLREGERLRVLLELGTDQLLDTGGRIVRIDPAGLAGVHLDRVSADDRQRLVRYVALRQREALAALQRD